MQRRVVPLHVEIAIRDFQLRLPDKFAVGKTLNQQLKGANRLLILVGAEIRPAEIKLGFGGVAMSRKLLAQIGKILPRLLEFFQLIRRRSRVIQDILRHVALRVAMADFLVHLDGEREIFRVQRRVSGQQEGFRRQ